MTEQTGSNTQRTDAHRLQPVARNAPADAVDADFARQLKTELAAKTRELAEAKAQSEALARAVMTDTVSNDDSLRVFKVTFPHGETVYFGEESAAKACARVTGIVENVALARRNFSVVPTDRFEKLQTTMAKLVDKYTGTPCEQIKAANEYMEISEDRDHWKAEADRLREALNSANKWIVNRGSGLPDHACKQCAPHSDILVDGFVCAYHAAIDAARAQGGEHG